MHLAWRWFTGLGFDQEIPHHSTFSKNLLRAWKLVDESAVPVLRLVSYAYMPSPLPRQVQWSLFARLSPLPAAFPVKK